MRELRDNKRLENELNIFKYSKQFKYNSYTVYTGTDVGKLFLTLCSERSSDKQAAIVWHSPGSRSLKPLVDEVPASLP